MTSTPHDTEAAPHVRDLDASAVLDAVVRQRQQPGLLRVRGASRGDGRVQHRGRVQVAHVGCGLGVERGAGHARNLDPTTDSFRTASGENRVVHKGIPGPGPRAG